MQTLTIQKFAAALVGVAMIAGAVFAFAAQRAHAATLSELVELFIALDIISEDKADEAREAVADMGDDDDDSAPTTGGKSCSFTFTQNLTAGSSGAEVMNLQKFLNMWPETQVSAAGAGAPGMETMTFGPATKAAVIKFQNKYASEVLAPVGLTAGTGYWGASSRAKANALCAGGPSKPPAPGDDDDDSSDDDDDNMSDEEASLEDFNASSEPSDEELEEGDEEVAVYGFEFDVEDGDVEVNRVDVRFEMTGTSDEDEPWNVFDSVFLMDADGKVIAEQAADDEDDWSNETGDAWEMRFNGVDERFDAGDTAEMQVGVSVASNLDDGDIDDADEMEWTVWVPEDGVRATDGAGLDQYIGEDGADEAADADESETFTIEAAGEGTELKISSATDNPEASTIKVSTDDSTDNTAVAVFGLEAKDGEVTVNKIVLFATTSTTSLGHVINDLSIEIDGETYDDWSYEVDTVGGTGGDTIGNNESAWIIFDLEEEDDEFTIGEDEEVEMTINVDFKQQEGNYSNGTSIEFDVTNAERDEWAAEDVNGDDLDDADKKGTGNGEEHTLIAEGIYAEINTTDADVNQGDNNANDEGNFVIKFDVTAFEDTFYMGSTTAQAVTFHVERGGATISTTTTASLSSTAKKESGTGNFRIDEGDTETFTLNVSLNPADGGTGYYRIELDTLNYNDDNSTTYGSSYTASPDEDFETDEVQLDA